MGHKHKRVFKKHTRKLRFRRRENNGFILAVEYIHKWRKFKELLGALEEDAQISKKKIFELLSSLEYD